MKRLSLTLLLSLFLVFSYSQDNQNCACCTQAHKAFDFWIGEWQVTNPNGQPAGTNKIKKVQDGCVLRENWTSVTPGYTGTSNNFYNAKTGQWEQLWIDNQGQSLHLKGNRDGNRMILKTDPETNSDGKSFYHQVTWTHNRDGTVRQHWLTFTEGEDPVTAFDGLYKRKKK